MKFQNPSLNSVLNGRKDGRTDERTSRKQYAPHFFKVGGIKISKFLTPDIKECSNKPFTSPTVQLFESV